MSDIETTVVQEVTKASPVIGVNLAAWFGQIELSTVVHVVTLLYLGLQAAYLIWKWRKEAKGKKHE